MTSNKRQATSAQHDASRNGSTQDQVPCAQRWTAVTLFTPAFESATAVVANLLITQVRHCTRLTPVSDLVVQSAYASYDKLHLYCYQAGFTVHILVQIA